MNKILPRSQTSYVKTSATIGMIVLILWIIFSVLYMVNDQWNDFQLVKMQQAYNKGVADSISTLITESDKCSAVPLYYENQRIDVVAVKCLPKQEDSEAEIQEQKNTETINQEVEEEIIEELPIVEEETEK